MASRLFFFPTVEQGERVRPPRSRITERRQSRRHVGNYLGLGLANSVHLFNPSVLIIDQQLSLAGQPDRPTYQGSQKTSSRSFV